MSVAQKALNFSSLPAIGEFVSKKVGAHHRLELDWVRPSKRNELAQKLHEGVLIGPTDRYSVGELLMPHVLTRSLGLSRLRCAGMVSSDFSPVGGHSVRNYGESALEMGGRDLQLIHFGGETLAEDIVESYAAVTSGEEEDRFESLCAIDDQDAVRGYVRRRSGQLDDFAYVLAPEGEFFGSRSSFHSVGLSNPEKLNERASDRLTELLQSAEFVGIRDRIGAEYLEGKGIDVTRMPCGLSVLPQVCARQLSEHRDSPAMEEIRHRFPNGWIAVEVGGVEERHFEKLSRALRHVSEADGLGLVFFEAAKRDYDVESPKLRHWVEAHAEWEAAAFASSNIWDVASMLMHSRLYCGSCLNCRVIAMAGGVPRVNLPTGESAIGSYCDLWELDSVPAELEDKGDWDAELLSALNTDFSMLEDHAGEISVHYFEALQLFSDSTEISLTR